MKNFIYKYRKIIKVSMIVPLFIFFISYGCQNSETDQQQTQLNYSGEEIFKGIFFSQGELPNQIEALKSEHDKSENIASTNKKIKDFQLDFSKEIIKSINTLDPTFFDQFKKQMESKNYYAIQLAMANATKMIKAGGYTSKYSGYFKLTDKLESKNADFSTKDFQDLDVSTPEGIAKYKSLIKDKYDINVDDDDYKVACSLGAVVCVVYLVAGAINTVVAAYYVVAGAVVYTKVEFWGGGANEGTIGNVLIEELALKLGSSSN